MPFFHVWASCRKWINHIKKKKKFDWDEREWTKPEDIGKRKENGRLLKLDFPTKKPTIFAATEQIKNAYSHIYWQ
jgi:hypothetical protein